MPLLLKNISKQYGAVTALKDISLHMTNGVWGLVGPNGAGKSTLMAILATLTRPSTGSAAWNGTDIHRNPEIIRSRLGYMPQEFGVYPNLNPVEFLHYMAAVKGLSARRSRDRIKHLMDALNLTAFRTRPLGACSTGTRQRVGIAAALLNDPEILIIDEPTAGLDPEERIRFRHLLTSLGDRRLVILSTHIVSDIEAVATDIAILDAGRLLAAAPPERLLREAEGCVWEMVIPSSELPAAQRRWTISSSVRRPDGIHLRIVSQEAPSPVAKKLPPSLEDAYFLYTRGARGPGAGMPGNEGPGEGGARGSGDTVREGDGQ